MNDEDTAPAPPPAKKKKPGPHTRKKRQQARAQIADLEAEVARLKGELKAPLIAPAPVREQAAPPVASVLELGPPPDDVMASQAWAHRVVAFELHDVVTDTNLSKAARRKMVIQLAGNLTKLVPDSRRWESEKMIREDRAEIDRKARAKSGAKLEPRPPKVRSAPSS